MSLSNFLLSVLLLSGDVEMNPGPKLISKESFSNLMHSDHPSNSKRDGVYICYKERDITSKT